MILYDNYHCDYCGKVATNKKADLNNHLFCSDECLQKFYNKHGINHKGTHEGYVGRCNQCGKKISYDDRHDSNGHMFCSSECYEEFYTTHKWNEGTPSPKCPGAYYMDGDYEFYEIPNIYVYQWDNTTKRWIEVKKRDLINLNSKWDHYYHSTPTYTEPEPTPQVIEKKVVVEQGPTIAISDLSTNRDIHVMDANNHSYIVHVRNGVITTSQIT